MCARVCAFSPSLIHPPEVFRGKYGTHSFPRFGMRVVFCARTRKGGYFTGKADILREKGYPKGKGKRSRCILYSRRLFIALTAVFADAKTPPRGRAFARRPLALPRTLRVLGCLSRSRQFLLAQKRLRGCGLSPGGQSALPQTLRVLGV